MLRMLLWALLAAAPAFSQTQPWIEPRIAPGEPEWVRLLESEAEVRASMGQPAMAADFGKYRSWQYRIGGEVEHDDFSHVLVFRKADGKLISLSRNYVPERNVDAFFPAGLTAVYAHQGFRVRVRRLSGGRVLIGSGGAGQSCGQLVLMLEAEMREFYPWVPTLP